MGKVFQMLIAHTELTMIAHIELTIIAKYIYINSISQSKKISNDQELIQSDPTSYPQNQKGNN